MLIDLKDFLKLRNSLPAVDVRSESEFTEGHVPGAINIPLLRNDERVAVGTDYKQKGQLEAIKTAFRLVGPRILDIVNEAEGVAQGREMLVHCWRGGMRSANFCQFVSMAKIKTHQLQGGYKVYRHHVLDSFKQPFKFWILGGFTGSGKSEVLRALARRGEQVIDLEMLAHHRGSVFGGLMMPAQPSTEQFQNNLSEALSKMDLSRRIWLEDESITIGKLVIPAPFWERMNKSPILQIDVDRDARIRRLVNEYGPADRDEFHEAMMGIVKKLGGQHYQAAKEKLYAGDMASTIDILLTYYDKAYRTGLSKKEERIRQKYVWDGKDAEAVASAISNL